MRAGKKMESVNSQRPIPNSQGTLGRSALRTSGVVRTLVSGIAPEHVGARRDAASAQRQFEKRTAGAPIREGADSPPARESPLGPTDWVPACGRPGPERPSSGHRRRCIFPRVRPIHLRSSSSGETSPKPWRRRGRRGSTCSGALGPPNLICWELAFGSGRRAVVVDL
jgi:hypothetical protein